MKYVGRHNSRALLGFHRFTGADCGGKFVGLSMKTWMTAFLSLDDNDHIVETTSRLREGPISMSTDGVSETTPAMPASVKSLETFVCKVYAPKRSTRILSELRWVHFSSNNLESQMLPHIVGTLIPHVQRVNYMVKRDRGPHSSVPNLEDGGWSEKGPPSKLSYPLHPVLW